MKYVPKIPDGDVNTPKENILQTLLFTVVSIGLIICLIYFILGFFVDIVVQKIPFEYEKELGYALFVRLNNREMTENEKKLQKILDGLVKHTDLKGVEFKIKIYETDEKNALALPGGNIIIFKGLLKLIGNEEKKIAAVLAHELGHYAHRDHLRAIGRRLVLAVILKFLTGSDNFLANLFSYSLDSIQLKYSRDQEIKADLFAVDLLYKKYKITGEIIEVLDKLGKYEEMSKYFFFFSTHPAYEDRIKAIKKHIEKKYNLNIKAKKEGKR